MRKRIKIVEVGPRDGLQNEAKILSVGDRVEFIRRLEGCGLKDIEGGSFVSPKAIPQMADSELVFKGLTSSKTSLSFLVPNLRGLERAIDAGVKSIALFSATSNTFTKKNINMTVEESLESFGGVAKVALKNKISIRGYVSTAFGCPYEGDQPAARVVEVAQKLFSMGCSEVSIGDTIGVASALQVEKVFGALDKKMGLKKMAGHFHDTRGMALVNIKAAHDLGIQIFDSSVGGLGGCPYAQGSSGNVATEEVCAMFEGMGFESGVNLAALLEVARWVEEKISRPLKSRLYLSRPQKLVFRS